MPAGCLKIRPAPWKKKNYSSWRCCFWPGGWYRTRGGAPVRDQELLSALLAAGEEETARQKFVAAMVELAQAVVIKNQEPDGIITRAQDYIRQNFRKDISLEEVARTVGISPYYFSKLFKQGTGENFIEYLTRTRMRQACVCLRNPDYSIKQICAMVGYSDPNYFSRIFKKYEGVNPSEYRERMENGAGKV